MLNLSAHPIKLVFAPYFCNMLKVKENRKGELNSEPEDTLILLGYLFNVVHWKNLSCPVLV
jgi:hypothetical protein